MTAAETMQTRSELFDQLQVIDRRLDAIRAEPELHLVSEVKALGVTREAICEQLAAVGYIAHDYDSLLLEEAV